MYKGHLVRLYPNQAQTILLGKHLGCVRWVYNHMVVINQKRYHRTGKGMTGYQMQAMLPKLKKQYPWLSEVNASSLQIVCHNLADAYNRFFKKVSKYPSFKKRRDSVSFTSIGASRIDGNKIRLPKLGLISFRGGKIPRGITKKFTVFEKSGKFYASILIDDGLGIPEKSTPSAILGIDMGISDLAVTSVGDAFEAPKFFRRTKLKLKKAQQKLSRCIKGSKRRVYARLKVAKIHEKIANQRKDISHKITRILVSESENQAFGIESLAVKNMMKNRKLSLAIADSGWNQFTTFLKYKADAVGKHVVEVDRWFPSSKACSACGVVRQSLPLSTRVWTCGDCGCVHQRDVNAAVNIAREAARNAVFNGRGDGVRPLARVATVCEASSPSGTFRAIAIWGP